jgi:hypothetical protein
MQHFCTRCGNPRTAGVTACAWCGKDFDQPAEQLPDQAGPDGGRAASGWPAEPRAYPEPPTRADASIPVYEEPQPTTWDYTLPRDSGPQSWGAGYYDEPQRLTADARDPFWTVFSAPPAPPTEPVRTSPPRQPPALSPPSWQAPPDPASPWLVPPQPGPSEPGPGLAQLGLAQPAARQPASHRLIPARPAAREHRRRPIPRPSGTLAAAAVLLVLAFGGGAYALVTTLTGHSGKASGHPAAAAGVPTSAAAQTSSLPAATSPPAAVTPVTTSPAASPTSPAASATTPPAAATTPPAATEPPTTTQPPPPGTVTVAVSPAARSDSAEPQVLAWVERYFTTINSHDYQAYVGLLDAQMAAKESPSEFRAGFGSTTDSAATLTGISDVGGGEAASVSFTSHQAPSQSIDGRSCDLWSITLYLSPSGSSYVENPPPPGYHSSHQAC